MTTTPNPANENSDGPDVNDVLRRSDDDDVPEDARPDADEPDQDVGTGLSEG